MNNLSKQKCEPCNAGTKLLTKDECLALLDTLKEWTVTDNKLEKSFRFNDFKEALAFTNQVGQLAEIEGHHPAIELTWGKVKITLWTHKIKGLSKNDFIMASKIDLL